MAFLRLCFVNHEHSSPTYYTPTDVVPAKDVPLIGVSSIHLIPWRNYPKTPSFWELEWGFPVICLQAHLSTEEKYDT
jgi:hypothetical protein